MLGIEVYAYLGSKKNSDARFQAFKRGMLISDMLTKRFCCICSSDAELPGYVKIQGMHVRKEGFLATN
jgi:hypothetical protein